MNTQYVQWVVDLFVFMPITYVELTLRFFFFLDLTFRLMLLREPLPWVSWTKFYLGRYLWYILLPLILCIMQIVFVNMKLFFLPLLITWPLVTDSLKWYIPLLIWLLCIYNFIVYRPSVLDYQFIWWSWRVSKVSKHWCLAVFVYWFMQEHLKQRDPSFVFRLQVT